MLPRATQPSTSPLLVQFVAETKTVQYAIVKSIYAGSISGGRSICHGRRRVKRAQHNAHNGVTMLPHIEFVATRAIRLEQSPSSLPSMPPTISQQTPETP